MQPDDAQAVFPSDALDLADLVNPDSELALRTTGNHVIMMTFTDIRVDAD